MNKDEIVFPLNNYTVKREKYERQGKFRDRADNLFYEYIKSLVDKEELLKRYPQHNLICYKISYSYKNLFLYDYAVDCDGVLTNGLKTIYTEIPLTALTKY